MTAAITVAPMKRPVPLPPDIPVPTALGQALAEQRTDATPAIPRHGAR
jgi:hypothetical protein